MPSLVTVPFVYTCGASSSNPASFGFFTNFIFAFSNAASVVLNASVIASFIFLTVVGLVGTTGLTEFFSSIMSLRKSSLTLPSICVESRNVIIGMYSSFSNIAFRSSLRLSKVFWRASSSLLLNIALVLPISPLISVSVLTSCFRFGKSLDC